MNSAPTEPSSSRRRCSFVSSMRSRLLSTPGPRSESRQLRHLPLEFLEHLAADVAARVIARISSSDRPRRASTTGRPRVVMHGLLVEEIEAQEIAHPLVERLLVDDRAPGRVGRGHAASWHSWPSIVRHGPSRRHNPTIPLPMRRDDAAGDPRHAWTQVARVAWRAGPCRIVSRAASAGIAGAVPRPAPRARRAPVLTITSSAKARRASRLRLRLQRCARLACSRVTPSRRIRRSICMASGTLDHEHAVDVVAAAALDEQRDHEHLVRAARGRADCRSISARIAGCRIASRRRRASASPKICLAQPRGDRAVPSSAEHLRAEGIDHGCERRLSRLDDLARDDVGVDHRSRRAPRRGSRPWSCRSRCRR